MIVPDRTPRRFALLVLPSFSNMTLAAVMEPMRVANRLAGRPVFTWQVLTESGASVASSSGLVVRPDAALADAAAADGLLAIASYDADRHATQPVRRALRAAARRGAAIGGMESAAYVLASAGVLDGFRATTHWEDLADFAERFPALQVVPDRFVIDRNRMTSGGALPTLDLMLELVRREFGPALALGVSSAFLYDRHQGPGDPQHMRAVGPLARRDRVLVRAIRVMERHIETPLPVAAIAGAVGVSPRELHRRFTAGLSVGPLAYYQELRLFLARRLLENTDHPVARVAVMAGFGSGSAFARAFRAQFGGSPSDVRQSR